MNAVRVAAALWLALLSSISAAPQVRQPPSLPPVSRPQSPATPRFRSAVDLVHLDVSVLDRDRRPVRGLTPADFTILEDGVAQKIAVFTAVEVPPAAAPAAAWMRDVTPDVRTNDRVEERRLFLLIIDDAMIQGDADALKNTRTIARQVIDRLGPSDLAAVVYTLDNRNSQDYTADRTRLLAAVNRFHSGFRDMSSIAPDDLYWVYSADVVRRAIEAMSTLPDRRKSIIYIGQGIPLDLELAATPQAPGLPSGGGVSAISKAGLAVHIRTIMERAFREAQRANVNVYPIDVCGLRVEKPRAPVMPGGLPPPPPACQPGLELDYLLTMAENTNAQPVVNTSEFSPGIQKIFDENASYYLLGYQPSNPINDGKFRRIEVKVNRPRFDIRTRSGYQGEKARDAEKRRAELARSPLGAALSGLVPRSGIPLELHTAVFPRATKKEAAVALVLGVRQPIRPNTERTIEKVDLQVSAFNVDGKTIASKRMLAEVVIRAGASGLAEYQVRTHLDLKPGRYQLRTAVHIGSLQTSGSLYTDVEVPDLSKAPVTLSDVVLTSAPPPVGAPADAFRNLIAEMPTTTRIFGSEDRVTALIRVYVKNRNQPAPVQLRVSLRDANDRVIMDRTQAIPAASFGSSQSTDAGIDLPLSRLSPGEYLLTIETGAGAAAMRRNVRFTRR